MRPPVLLVLAAACGGGQPPATIPAPPVATTSPVVAPAPVAPPVAVAKTKKIRSVEGITEYTLDNGLQVLLFPDATQSTVTVNVT